MRMMLWQAHLILGVCIFNSQLTHSAKILSLSFPVYSHIAQSKSVATELIKRGHHVIFYLPEIFNASKQLSGITYIRYGEASDTEWMARIQKLIKDVSVKNISPLEVMRVVQPSICNPLLEDLEGLEKLRQEKFDFALVDYMFYSACNFLIPYNLSIPFAVISSLIPPLAINHPVATSFMPFYVTPYTVPMSFHQRFINTMAHFLSFVALDYLIEPYDSSKMAPGLSWEEVQNLPQKADLFIENTDVVFNYPKPTMPNFIQVGGLTTKEAEPLPASIQNFFDESTDGVIIVSFGSAFQFSDSLKKTFLSVFRQLKQKVYLKADEEKQIDNVLISKWLPQNDALAHPNTRLMIYHCGNNGMFECLYHGVPLLCVPQVADQFTNSYKLDYLQIGLFLHVSELTEKSLLEAIRQILNNPKYSNNMKRLSTIFHDRPETPAQRAASAMEHVIKYGGNHLRLNQVELSAFQLLTGDVWLAIFFIILVILKIIICIFLYICRALTSRKKLKKQ